MSPSTIGIITRYLRSIKYFSVFKTIVKTRDLWPSNDFKEFDSFMWYLLSTYHPILWNMSPLTLVRHDGQLFTSLTGLHKQQAWHWLKTCCFDIQIICQFTRMSRHWFITKLMMEAWHKNIIKTMVFGGCWDTNAPLTSSPMSQIWPIRGQHDSRLPIRGPEWF